MDFLSTRGIFEGVFLLLLFSCFFAFHFPDFYRARVCSNYMSHACRQSTNERPYPLQYIYLQGRDKNTVENFLWFFLLLVILFFENVTYFEKNVKKAFSQEEYFQCNIYMAVVQDIQCRFNGIEFWNFKSRINYFLYKVNKDFSDFFQ